MDRRQEASAQEAGGKDVSRQETRDKWTAISKLMDKKREVNGRKQEISSE